MGFPWAQGNPDIGMHPELDAFPDIKAYPDIGIYPNVGVLPQCGGIVNVGVLSHCGSAHSPPNWGVHVNSPVGESPQGSVHLGNPRWGVYT